MSNYGHSLTKNNYKKLFMILKKTKKKNKTLTVVESNYYYYFGEESFCINWLHSLCLERLTFIKGFGKLLHKFPIICSGFKLYHKFLKKWIKTINFFNSFLPKVFLIRVFNESLSFLLKSYCWLKIVKIHINCD